MDINETTRICKAIASIKPAQYMAEETPAFWAMILTDVRYEDARQAVINLGGKTKFIDPSDIITEAKAIRNARLGAAGIGNRTLGDTPEEHRKRVKAIADGEATPPQAQIEGPQDVRLTEALASGIFKRPPRVAAAIEGAPG